MKGVQRRASDLERTLAELDADTVAALSIGDPTIQPGYVRKLLEQAGLLGDAAEAALSSLKSVSPGRPRGSGINFAIRELYNLYRQHFPDRRGYRSKPTANYGYDGEFFEFVCELFELLKIQRSRSAIGKQIQLAISDLLS